MKVLNDNKYKIINIIILLAVGLMLLLGTCNTVFADDTKTANAPLPSTYEFHPIDQDNSVFSHYCLIVKDARMTTMDRDKYVKEGTLEKQILKKCRAKIKTYAEHQSTNLVEVTGVSGIKKVEEAELVGGYKTIKIELKLKGFYENEGVELTDTDSVSVKVILVSEIPIATTEKDKDDSTAVADTSGNSGTKATAADKAVNAKEKAAKAATGSIAKKTNSDSTLDVVDSQSNESGNNVDTMGILMLAVAGLVALLFAISIISDIGVIKWYNQKKAMRLKY